MPESTQNIIGMCLREARKAAGYDNAGQAALKVNRSPETVGRHERGDIPLSPEDAIQYAAAYARPDILIRYCDGCPVHKAAYGDTPVCDRSLPWGAMRIANRLRRSAQYAEKLETILDDGIVNEDELPDLMEVFDFLRDVGQAGRELLAESLSLGILKDTKKAAPTGMGATERARITHSKADHKAHSHCTTA
ncbi:MAG: helix-turn-helix transcriptional regulator [Candidatus Limiplasma sp.]|nr:helix-turn-helix transcriptional regulator [Candidatus Limiplasma sp.]